MHKLAFHALAISVSLLYLGPVFVKAEEQFDEEPVG